jgi:hypothetical protein
MQARFKNAIFTALKKEINNMCGEDLLAWSSEGPEPRKKAHRLKKKALTPKKKAVSVKKKFRQPAKANKRKRTAP